MKGDDLGACIYGGGALLLLALLVLSLLAVFSFGCRFPMEPLPAGEVLYWRQDNHIEREDGTLVQVWIAPISPPRAPDAGADVWSATGQWPDYQ